LIDPGTHRRRGPGFCRALAMALTTGPAQHCGRLLLAALRQLAAM
jgi:hypothetical protein